MGAIEVEQASIQPMVGQVLLYRSRLFGDRQPMVMCATDLAPEPKPLLVDLIPGTYGNPQAAIDHCENICRVATQWGWSCVALRPCGRGNGTLYQGYGEVDLFEAIETVMALVSIDRERVSLSGASMGGAATWFHASHHADYFSAAAPFCGYCDYRLWEKPGGTTFHRQGWETYSWISRDAAFRAPALRGVPLRITHGEWDRSVGYGVPVTHSRQMHSQLEWLDIPHTYVEVPRTGHDCRTPALWEETIAWLLEQKRASDPERVSLVVHTLRHNRSHWVSVERQERSGRATTVEARADRARGHITVRTTNAERITLGPLRDAAGLSITVDGISLSELRPDTRSLFGRSPKGTWVTGSPTGPAGPDSGKRPGLSGPFGDLFHGPVVIVYGLSGSEEVGAFNRMMAFNAAQFFRQYNGGLHRGGIPGELALLLPAVSDREMLSVQDGGPAITPPGNDIAVDRDLLERANLFFIGGFTSNAALARTAPSLPVAFHSDRLVLGGRRFDGVHLACYAIFPHPDGTRYVALLAGGEPDAICWGSHVGLQLLPDYLVFDHARTVAWGFFDNDWRAGGSAR